jgi:hypothetical protein
MTADWSTEHVTTGAGGGGRRDPYRGLPKRKFYTQVLEQLRVERKSWEDHWQAILNVTQPRRARFDRESVNRTTRNDGILNGKGQTDTRTLVSGLFARICSPSENWFGLGTDDDEFDRSDEDGQRWRAAEERGIKKTLEDGDVYRVLEQVIEDMVGPATGAAFIDDDIESVVQAYHMPLGSYFLATSAKNQIDTCFRELSMTPVQMEEKFGMDALSARVRKLLDETPYAWQPVVHVVAPNKNYWPGRIESGTGKLSKKWTSCWWDAGGSENEPLLAEDGYYEFPVVPGRWATTGENVWGSGSPGMLALGDMRELQEVAFDSALVGKQMGMPPLGAPATMFGTDISAIPGSVTYLDNASLSIGIKPILEVNGAQLGSLNDREERIESRIAEAYYVRLWQMLQDGGADGARMTATEIQERRNEKMSLLGPLTIRFQMDVLRRVVMLVFHARMRAGLVKPWPQSMVGKSLKLVFRSEFSQAQKANQALVLDRLFQFYAAGVEVTQGAPEVLHKLDIPRAIDIYAEGLGADPGVTRAAKALEKIVQAAAEQQAKLQKQAELAQQAETLKNMAGADLSKDNALRRLGSEVEQQGQVAA